jgi:hypothetical protein
MAYATDNDEDDAPASVSNSTRPSSVNLIRHLTSLKRKGKLSAVPTLRPKRKKAKTTSTTPAAGAVNKVAKSMSEFKQGSLHSGSKTGPVVKNRKQAVAIGLSEQKKENKGGYAFKKL